jgi:hypothetical protein
VRRPLNCFSLPLTYRNRHQVILEKVGEGGHVEGTCQFHSYLQRTALFATELHLSASNTNKRGPFRRMFLLNTMASLQTKCRSGQQGLELTSISHPEHPSAAALEHRSIETQC